MNLISSLGLSGSFLLSEPLLVTVGLSITVGNARAVVFCGRLASALAASKGKECLSSGCAPQGEISLTVSTLQTCMTMLAVICREVSHSKNRSCLEIPELGGAVT